MLGCSVSHSKHHDDLPSSINNPQMTKLQVCTGGGGALWLMLRAAQGILLNLLQASEALTGKQAGSSEHVLLRLLSAAAKPLVPVCWDLARTVHATSMPCGGSVSKWVQRVRGPCRLPASMQVLLCQLNKQS
jgi:hypothetical protein